jgi:hypothetical protein
VLVGYVTPDQTSHIIRFHTDQRVVMSVFLARVLWLQGFPDQAARTAHSSVGDARAANHTISLCVALAHAACPIALLTGDLAAAEHYGTMLLDHSTRHALAHWRACGRSFQGVLVIKRGDVITGLRLLRAGLDEFGEEGSTVLRLIAFLMAEALGPCRAERRRARRDRGGDRAFRAHRRALGDGRVSARQGRASMLQGAPGTRGGGRGSFSASAPSDSAVTSWR